MKLPSFFFGGSERGEQTNTTTNLYHLKNSFYRYAFVEIQNLSIE